MNFRISISQDDIIILHIHIKKLHVDINKLQIDMNKLHVNIVVLYVDIMVKKKVCRQANPIRIIKHFFFQKWYQASLYGGILLPPICKIRYGNMQHKYVKMRLIYDNMQQNFVSMRYNYVNMQLNLFFISTSLCCMIV